MKDNICNLLDKIEMLVEQAGGILVAVYDPKQKESIKIFDTDYSSFWFDSDTKRFYIEFLKDRFKSFDYSINEIKEIFIENVGQKNEMFVSHIRLDNGQTIMIHTLLG